MAMDQQKLRYKLIVKIINLIYTHNTSTLTILISKAI